VTQPTAVTALARLEEEMPDAEFAAAVAYAKRRRLGVFRAKADLSPERQRKDMAAMARAGFAIDLAKRALAGAEE
jgi:regulatory protein